MLTSKGASGVTGAGFITLAATLAVVRHSVPGMAILGIDRFMSECRALTNIAATASRRSSSPPGRANSTAKNGDRPVH